MVNQTSVNGKGTAQTSHHVASDMGGVAEFIGDIASLAELQAQLAAVDLREAARKSAVPIAFILVGFVVVVGAVPVAFLGVGGCSPPHCKSHRAGRC